MSLIQNYLYGWNELEPSLLACIAMRKSVLLIGKHGSGKTSFMRFVSAAMSRDGQPAEVKEVDATTLDKQFKMTKYAMDKENLISMVGIPNAEKMKEGEITYATHQRSVFNADAILLDEITRASKENQNMVLEILEERTVFGLPLKYQFAVATANDETYKGAMKLDAALLDRFYVVLPVPDAGTDQARFGPEELQKIIELNLGGRKKDLAKSDQALVKAMEDIRSTCNELWTKTDKDGNTYLRDNVIEFAAKFLSQVITNMAELNKSRKADKFFMSLRQIGDHFSRLVMATAAYFKAVKDDPEYLQNGAWEAIKYSLCTKICFPEDKLRVIFEGLKDLLTDGDALIGKLKIDMATGSIESRIKTLTKYGEIVVKNFELDEIVNCVGNVIQEIDVKKPEDMRHLGDLVEAIEDHSLPENCLYAARMKQWRFAADPETKLVMQVLAVS